MKQAAFFNKIKDDFPQTSRFVRNKPLIYLDSAATSLKPNVVSDRVKAFYSQESANVSRGAHYLGDSVTIAYENARADVAKFIHAKSHEISFNSGTTMAINILAKSFAQKYLKAGDEVLVTQMEHHANIVPWQMICEEKSCHLKVIPMSVEGELDLTAAERLLDSGRVKIVAVTYISNVLGTINPIEEICRLAHRYGAKVMVDAAQAALHLRFDVRHLDCDFLAFSGHKMLCPTGVGVLYIKEKYLEELPPVIGGGHMIRSVSFAKTIYAEAPAKFEAGTPPIASVLGLASAIDYIESLGTDLKQVEEDLSEHFRKKLSEVEGLTLYGSAKNRIGIFSFTLLDIHPHDVGSILDTEGIATRTGHHCCQPLMDFYGIPAMVRVSPAFYNTFEDADVLVKALEKAKAIFK